MKSKLQNLLSWGKMTSNPADSVQVTVQSGETINNVPRLQDFGFTSKPAVDSVGIFMARNGVKDAGMLINPQDRSSAPSLANGETALYNNHGTTVILKASGDVEISGGNVTVDGDVIVTGSVEADTDVQDGNATTPTMLNMRSTYNTHTHPISGAVTLVPSQPM